MLSFPGREVFDVHQVVYRRHFRDVDDGRRTDEAGERDPVVGETALGEVNRSVQVRAAVLGGGELVRRIEPPPPGVGPYASCLS